MSGLLARSLRIRTSDRPASFRTQDHPEAFNSAADEMVREVLIRGTANLGGRCSRMLSPWLIETEVNPADRSTDPLLSKVSFQSTIQLGSSIHQRAAAEELPSRVAVTTEALRPATFAPLVP